MNGMDNMDKNIDIQLKYKLKRLTDTKSDEFHNALRIYSQNITYDQKTNTNEIAYWINHIESFSGCTPFFFALFLNNQIIGYAELAYIKEARILAIDYIVIDNQYKSNSAFYAFYHLIINYFDRLGIDNFKVINALYIHPQLETNNAESRKEALLMLYQKDQTYYELKSETYISIVKAIYFQYYEIWDAPFWKNHDELNTNHENLVKDLEEICTTIEDGKVLLNGYPIAFSTSSDRASIPENSQKTIKKSFIYASIILMLTFLILFFSKELNVQLTTIAIVSLAILFVILTFIALSDNKATKIIEKLPVFSKLFALLK